MLFIILRKTFKYRLLGSKTTFAKADDWLHSCRLLYNAALGLRIAAYKQNKRIVSGYDQMKQLPAMKEVATEYKSISAQTLQDVIDRLDKAYKSFFRRIRNGDNKVGFPRFKSIYRYDSFTLKQNGWKLDGKYLSIHNIGRFKLRLSRPIQGNIKTVTIRRKLTGKWYVCFSCDKVPEHRLEPSTKSIGIDVGIKSFSVDSDGHKEFNPTYFRCGEKQLKVRQRKLSRRIKGSQGRKEARLLVAKTHEKITNQRKHFLHKIANYYIKNYGVIFTEDLNIKGMSKNHHLAKSINDASWGKFFELLNYKAEEAGRMVIKVPRFEPTSKTCSNCGASNQELTLNDRQWVCKSCGVLHDRDYNAAKNICRVGQTLQELTYVVAQSVS